MSGIEKRIKWFENQKDSPVSQIVINKAIEFISCFKKFPFVVISCRGLTLHFQFVINRKNDKKLIVSILQQEYIIHKYSHDVIILNELKEKNLDKLIKHLTLDEWFEKKFKGIK